MTNNRLAFWSMLGVPVALIAVAFLVFGLPDTAAEFATTIGGIAGGVGFLIMARALWVQARQLRLQYEAQEDARGDAKEERKEAAERAAILRHHSEVVRQQNDLLGLVIRLYSEPMPRLEWAIDGNTATLTLRNDGQGQAVILEPRFEGPSWGGTDPDQFSADLRGQVKSFVGVEFNPDIRRGRGIPPGERITVLVLKVRGSPENWDDPVRTFHVGIDWIPQRGGKPGSCKVALADLRERWRREQSRDG